jgi:ribosomal protein S18 acetylase RimI-like enzyme
MHSLNIQPISQADIQTVAELMGEEERAWLRELDWDYAPIRRILVAFLRQRLLPGFVAFSGLRPVAYAYFLTSRSKSVIGTVYASTAEAHAAAEPLLSRSLDTLKTTRRLKRVEAQIIPLNGLDLHTLFTGHGFRSFLRHYLELDLGEPRMPETGQAAAIVPWSDGYMQGAAGVAYMSYRNEIDAEISDDYRSKASCEAYLRSLIENPGCGMFLADSSLVALDGGGNPCGFIVTSQISEMSAMIPQISIHPAHQGRGLGSALICHAFARLRTAGYRKVRLTVSHENRRAYEWYLRIGFRARRDFHAYLRLGDGAPAA